METKPDVPPSKPSIVKGVCEVSGSDLSHVFTVDLDTLECTCKHGQPWRWGGKRWVPNVFCSHKIKAIASLCEAHPDDIELRNYHDEQLGRRFNAFEAVSAMHKEVRRGDVDAALYWATMMIPHRGKYGVVTYLRNIVFEETRDLSLAKYILKISSYGKSVSFLDMQRVVHRFCVAPKKWELPWRYDIFIDEMRAYKKLAERHGYEVARAKDIIPFTQVPKFREYMIAGFNSGDRVSVQYGLKGWFKSQSPDHEHMKIDIFNTLIDIMNGEHANIFDYDENYTHDLYGFLMQRMRRHGGVGYHELNAFCDALTGEPGADPRATISKTSRKKITAFPKERRVALADVRKIPLYAHDNHTWAGKAKMRAHKAQLDPGASQTDIDFRVCGAYMGVAWRTLAYQQHSTIDCKWGDVSWARPNWLWKHLDSMWY